MSRIRTLTAALALSAAALLPAHRAEAQIAISSTCYPAAPQPCAFDIAQVLATAPPIELAQMRIDLLGGWSFASTAASGTDLFGPLPPLAAQFGTTPSSLVVDFLTPLNGPGSCFPYDGLTCLIVGFAVGGPFTPPTFVDLFLAPPTSGPSLDFAWEATNIDGTVYSGGPDQVVPEPSTWILLGTGLLALGVAYRRREREQERLRQGV